TKNLVGEREQAALLKQMRKQLDRRTFEARDIHFLPEYEIGLVSKKGTPYEYRMDKNKYPFNTIYVAASLSGKRDKKTAERQIELLKDDNPIVRYWAITGLRSQDGSLLNPHKKELLEAMKDTYPPVAISASAMAYQHFQNKAAAEKLKVFCQDDTTDLALMAVNALLYIDNKEPFVSTIEKVSQKPSIKYRVEAACMDFMHILGFTEKREQFEPGAIWEDTEGTPINAHGGGMLVHDDTYYWFGEHKIAGRKGNTAQVGVRVYASKDLYNWKNEGVALAVKEDTTSMLQRGSVIERPKVIYNDKTGKFVMWFHHELKGQGYKAAMTGTAVANQVTGPYEYLGSARVHSKVWPQNFTKEQQQEAAEILRDEDAERKQKRKKGAFLYRDYEGGQMSRDMTLFKDDDGTAYHITSSEENATLLISRLADDYLSLTDEYVRVFPGGNNEAPAIFKKEGKYYMITSGLTGWDPNPARSAVADNMMGPWKALGNPVRGSEEEKKTTFESQSTYVIPVQGKENAYIFMADRWRPKNPIDGRYVWLPIEFEDGKPILRWKEKWDLGVFEYSLIKRPTPRAYMQF
ncbi:MAG: family 43 glycosylhydrolase, partial [Pricia sp.]